MSFVFRCTLCFSLLFIVSLECRPLSFIRLFIVFYILLFIAYLIGTHCVLHYLHCVLRNWVFNFFYKNIHCVLIFCSLCLYYVVHCVLHNWVFNFFFSKVFIVF